MGRLTVAFAVAAGLAAGTDAPAQDVANSPAVAAAAQRPNFRAPKKPPATDTNGSAAPQPDTTDTGNSRFLLTPKADTTSTAPAVGAGAPYWQPVEVQGEPMDYFRYFGLNAATTAAQAADPAFNNEIRSSTTDPHRPLDGQPVTFNFQQSVPIAMETKFAGCPFTDQPDNQVFWFNPYANKDGSHTDLGTDPVNNPNYRYGVPGEWTISQPNYGVRGLNVTGAAEGNAPGAPDGGYAVAVSYVTDRRCSDANNEYGFWQELASPDPNAQAKDQSHVFYYSIKTNCYSSYGCRATNSWDGLGQDQTTGPLVTITNVTEGVPARGGLQPLGEPATETANATNPDIVRRPVVPQPREGQMFTYSAYMVPDDKPDADHATGYKFRVQVTDADRPSQFAKCSINGGPQQDCQIDVPIENFFPAQLMQTEAVQVVTGTQTSGVNAPAPLTPGAKFTVKGIALGK